MKPSENIALEPSLSREAYWDDRPSMPASKNAIFWDQWFYAGRAELLAGAGDYRVLDVAGESVILIRGRGRLSTRFLNFCRHRGSRVLWRRGRGARTIRCPYHAWAYALDGRLIASPFVSEDAVPLESRQPASRRRGMNGQGFVFVHLSPERAEAAGASLASQLGPIPERLARYPLAELKVARTLRYEVEANWKVMLENYNECYHCAGVHPELCRVVPAFKREEGRRARLGSRHPAPRTARGLSPRTARAIARHSQP